MTDLMREIMRHVHAMPEKDQMVMLALAEAVAYGTFNDDDFEAVKQSDDPWAFLRTRLGLPSPENGVKL